MRLGQYKKSVYSPTNPSTSIVHVKYKSEEMYFTKKKIQSIFVSSLLENGNQFIWMDFFFGKMLNIVLYVYPARI